MAMSMLQGRRQIEQRVTWLLQSLGDDADTVAATLAGEGVTGFRSQSRNCAIARYLGAVVGAEPVVGVITVSQTAVCISGRHWWTPKVRRTLPHAIRQFIIGFDTGRYPQLIAAGDRGRPLTGKAAGGKGPFTGKGPEPTEVTAVVTAVTEAAGDLHPPARTSTATP